MSLMGNTKTFTKSIFTGVSITAGQDIGDIYISQNSMDQGLFKAYIPRFLYKPPFGYPREPNLHLLRNFAKNPYIYSVNKTIKDEVGLADWDVVYRKDKETTTAMDNIREEIIAFFNNPNQNKESFTDIRKKVVEDILVGDSGVFVKVFDRAKRFKQMFAYDGLSFLKNPDIHGYMGNRDDFIPPFETSFQIQAGSSHDIIKQYGAIYGEKAAYFQFNTAVSASVPVPFGRREIIYMMQNPRTDSPYGRSPIEILGDVILTLVYGSNYSLDFFMNANMPEGIVQLLGANQPEISAFRKRIDKTYKIEDPMTGFPRRQGFRFPITATEAKFIPFQMDPKVMQIVEQQEWFYKLVLACYGLPPTEMGLTEDASQNVSKSQHQIYLRKSARPIMVDMKYKFDMEIIPEWGAEAYDSLEFKWTGVNLDEEIKRHELYKSQIDIGIKTPEMVAEEESIDFEEVKKFNEENRENELEKLRASGSQFNQNFTGTKPSESNTAEMGNPDKNEQKSKRKPVKPETPFEKELQATIRERTDEILTALENVPN